jgi:hypothetical protein
MPYWQIVGRGNGKNAALWQQIKAELNRGGSVVSVGPGNRIEFIGPFRDYNWAEGSRYIEAIKGARRMRTHRYFLDAYRKMGLMTSLTTMLAQLGLEPPK